LLLLLLPLLLLAAQQGTRRPATQQQQQQQQRQQQQLGVQSGGIRKRSASGCACFAVQKPYPKPPNCGLHHKAATVHASSAAAQPCPINLHCLFESEPLFLVNNPAAAAATCDDRASASAAAQLPCACCTTPEPYTKKPSNPTALNP
jgi:hypothetical protein